MATKKNNEKKYHNLKEKAGIIMGIEAFKMQPYMPTCSYACMYTHTNILCIHTESLDKCEQIRIPTHMTQ